MNEIFTQVRENFEGQEIIITIDKILKKKKRINR